LKYNVCSNNPSFFLRRSIQVIPKEIPMALSVGQMAPDFTLTSHTGQTIRLSDYRGKNVVLAFFPLAWTPV
jgi:peroxiredoxin